MVIVADDHALFRELVCKVCRQETPFKEVVGAGSGLTAIELIEASQPELVILDLQLPDCSGFKVMSTLSSTSKARFLTISGHCTPYTVYLLRKSKASGFVDKDTDAIATLKAAISDVAEGRTFFSERFMAVENRSLRAANAFSRILTDQEIRILTHIGRGLSDVEIGSIFHITSRTAQTHRSNIMRKLKIPTSRELVKYALENGFTVFDH